MACFNLNRQFNWKSLCRKNKIQSKDPRSCYNSSKFSPSKGLLHASTSFWSTFYDRTIRTKSYNEFIMKMEVLAPCTVSPSNHRSSEIDIAIDTDELLQPNQNIVETVLYASREVEGPEIMKIAVAYFDSNWKASRLCGTLLHRIRQARDQCHHIELMLSTMPRSANEALVYLQHKQMVEGLCEIARARNPFADIVMNRMFADVEESYNTVIEEVEERRILIGREVWVLEKWKGGCILHMVIRVVVEVMVVTVVVAMKTLASVVTMPFAAARTEHARTLKRVQCMKTQSFKRSKKQAKECGWKRIGFDKKQGAKIEALARGSFTVRRMLDTLRCLMGGLEEDVESKRRLAEFGWDNREEVVCVQQVAWHLHRSHLHLAQQLDNLQEQVVICLLIINKARDWVLQEFSPTPPYTP